jgi:hypothetical protein
MLQLSIALKISVAGGGSDFRICYVQVIMRLMLQNISSCHTFPTSLAGSYTFLNFALKTLYFLD